MGGHELKRLGLVSFEGEPMNWLSGVLSDFGPK